MEQQQQPKKSATDEEIQELVSERLLINAIKRRQANPPKNEQQTQPNRNVLT